LATSLIHSKIIAQAAKDTLSPLGVFQKGRSRTWIDDRGWWIVVIEFQPSSWSRGSYLNVGAMWLWHAKDYLSFDVGSRIASFVKYSDERQFTPEAVKLAALAREETLKLRRQFASVSEAARYLPKRARKHPNPWTELARGDCLELRWEAFTIAIVLREYRTQKGGLRMGRAVARYGSHSRPNVRPADGLSAQGGRHNLENPQIIKASGANRFGSFRKAARTT
jgi:hypothetical protein